jgi:ankyrin repeat protein
MKQLLITIAAVVLVGCGESVPKISIHRAAYEGDIKSVKQHLAAGTDVNARDNNGRTALDWAGRTWPSGGNHPEIADLLRKHGGKTGEELKAEWK